MIKAVIFDMNGVIVNDEPVHEKAFQEVLKAYDVNLTSADYEKLCLGKTDRDGFIGVVGKFSLDKNLLEELLERKSKKYLELALGKVESFPGVLDLVERLSKKYALALASGAIRSEIDMVLEMFKIKKYFCVIVSGEEVAIGKPNPDHYLLTAQRLNLEPDSCVVIEDSKSGVQAAKSAGMKCIAITTSYDRSDLNLADRVVDKFSEMPEILELI